MLRPSLSGTRLFTLGLCATLAGVILGWPGAAQAGGGKLTPEQAEFMDAVNKSQPAAAKTDGTASGQLGTEPMRRANTVASQIVEKRMERERAADLVLLRQAGAADIVVVKGTYDRVQDVLKALKIEHVVVPPHLVAKLPLMSTQTLMINCPGNLDRAGVRKVQRFVKTGGFLVTTDWAITLLPKAFPGYVTRGERNTGNDVVKVEILDDDAPFIHNVKTMKENPRWWLEGASYPIKVLDPKKVTVLITSREMKKKYGHAPIAVSFRYDDGKVLHMTSHFYLQQGKAKTLAEKSKGSAFAAEAGLSGEALEDLKKKGLDEVKAGDLNSAYSMQQVTANVVVSKQKQNRELLKQYSKRARKSLDLQAGPAGGPAAGQVGKDYQLRELERKDGRVKVRDLFGREGWVSEADLY